MKKFLALMLALAMLVLQLSAGVVYAEVSVLDPDAVLSGVKDFLDSAEGVDYDGQEFLLQKAELKRILTELDGVSDTNKGLIIGALWDEVIAEINTPGSPTVEGIYASLKSKLSSVGVWDKIVDEANQGKPADGKVSAVTLESAIASVLAIRDNLLNVYETLRILAPDTAPEELSVKIKDFLGVPQDQGSVAVYAKLVSFKQPLVTFDNGTGKFVAVANPGTIKMLVPVKNYFNDHHENWPTEILGPYDADLADGLINTFFTAQLNKYITKINNNIGNYGVTVDDIKFFMILAGIYQEPVVPTPTVAPSQPPVVVPTPTPTPSVSPSPSVTPTPSTSPEPSVTPTPSASPEVSPTPKPSATPIPGITPRPSPIPTAGTVIIEPVIEEGKAAVVVDEETLKQAAAEAPVNSQGVKEVKLALASDESAAVVEAQMPASFFAEPEEDTAVVLESNAATVSMPVKALQTLNLAEAKSVTLTVERTNAQASVADPALLAQIGDRPVIQINLKVDDKPVTWSNADAPVTLGIPYTPSEEELENPELIAIWYIDGEGKAQPIYASAYDSATGMVYVTLTHMSTYAVVYVNKQFTDIGASWAQNEITVMAAKGIINGTSSTALVFSPKSNIIRADFIKMLVQTLGITATVESNFPDVAQGTYYYDAVGVAKKLGITTGDGKGNFNPKSIISREDMMTLVARALDVTKKLSMSTDVTAIGNFSDNAKISGYAKQSVATLVDASIIQGNNNMISPKGYFTREEAAAVMYRLFNKFINPVK